MQHKQLLLTVKTKLLGFLRKMKEGKNYVSEKSERLAQAF